MLRFHSFYPAHREQQYEFLMDDQDREYFMWVNTICIQRAMSRRI
jgi:inositol oxygenase